MPGDSQDCRKNACFYDELATRAKDPVLRKAYSDLARRWLDLADELEKVNMIERAPNLIASWPTEIIEGPHDS
jgi:hypothetical protein